MNAETEPLRQAHAAVAGPSVTATGWRVALPIVVVAVAAILAIYWPTFESMVAIWTRSETFAHGYLIAPISLALIWSRRRELSRITPSPDWLGFLMLAGAGAAWLLAAAGHVQVVQEYAVVAMIPAAVLATTGRQVARALAFPLAFLFLGVPVGEVLIPPLMDWTANFTVAALRLTGIPVFREGTFFSIPSGNWSVVEGCSGLRYLIASITVGVLYAYLNYVRWWKRGLFVLMSVIVPIIANGLRAYMIVMIAHLSDMKLALGVDHLIYGWVFFGLVMLLLFWVGSFWRDPPADADDRTNTGMLRSQPTRIEHAALVASALGVTVIAAVWPAYAAHIERDYASAAAPVLGVPAPASGWSLATEPMTDWRPRYEGASASFFQTYRKGDRTVGVYVGYYRNQRQGAELITSQNIMVQQKHPVWANVGESHRMTQLGNAAVEIRETNLRSLRQRLLIWDWFYVAGRELTNPYVGKLLLARDRLLGRGDDAAAIIIAAPYDASAGDTREGEQALREFVQDMLPALAATLRNVRGEAVASSK